MANILNLILVQGLVNSVGDTISLPNAAQRVRAILLQPHNAAPTTSPENPS